MTQDRNEYSRAALVGIITGGDTEESVNTSLDELARLLDRLNMEDSLPKTII